MMIEANLKFITPCFCAGANPLEAEIRAPSIRGELRWWFRCLGGKKRDEDAVFGSVAGSGNASALQVRIFSVIRSETVYSPPHAKLEDHGAYLHFFLDRPPKNGRSRLWSNPPDPKSRKKGIPRPEGCFPPGSTFQLRIRSVRKISESAQPILDLAIRATLRFGSIGFRQTRGFGAWAWMDEPIIVGDLDRLTNEIEGVAPGFRFWIAPNAANHPDGLLNQVETKLKAMRKPEDDNSPALPAKKLTALGHSGEHGRQASAVRFRPVQIQTRKGETQYKLVVFQAPDGVLGPDVIEPKRIVPDLIPK